MKRDKLRVCRTSLTASNLVLTGCILAGLRVEEVRAIFRLPSQFGHFPHPLAYVHWFTSFRAWDPQLGMFKLSRSMQHHRPNAAIIRTNQIVQTCHLLPKFGSDIPHHWFSSNTLDHAPDFFFNMYLDLYVFEEFAPDDQ
jgi:hypothetical protein